MSIKGEIKTVFAIVAPGFSGQPGNVNSAFIFASLTPWENRRHQREIVRENISKIDFNAWRNDFYD